MNGPTYNDYLKRVSMKEVLTDAGYTFYRRDGLRYPAYVRYGSDGRRIHGDKFFVSGGGSCCFQPPLMKNWNVISFIKYHPQMFREYRPGISPDELVNLVCRRLMGMPPEIRASINTAVPQPSKFSMEAYDIQRFDASDRQSRAAFYPYFRMRGISPETRRAFADSFLLTTRKDGPGKGFTNLSFPLSVPGRSGTVGLEVRGLPTKEGSSFKGKAEGSDSSQGLWIASPDGTALNAAEHVFWFESAYDAMAFWQLHHDDGITSGGVFLSTGGTPTDGQMRGVTAVAPEACHHLGFDNDEAGRTFAGRFREVAAKENMKASHISDNAPQPEYKDWNDELLDRRTYHQDEDLIFSQDADGNVTVQEDIDYLEERREDSEEDRHKGRTR